MFRIHSLSIFFLSKKKKKIIFSYNSKKVCLNFKLPQDSNVLFFKYHYLQEKNVIQDKKAVTTLTTNTEFFCSVFSKTILIMYSHCLQIWFIQFVSTGSHRRAWQLSKASSGFWESQNHMKESICITDLQLVMWKVRNLDLCFLHLMQLIKRGLLVDHTLDYSSKGNYKMSFAK